MWQLCIILVLPSAVRGSSSSCPQASASSPAQTAERGSVGIIVILLLLVLIVQIIDLNVLGWHGFITF